MLRLLRRLARNEAGTSFIEFAIAGPVVILALLGCIEFGRYFWRHRRVQSEFERAISRKMPAPILVADKRKLPWI